MKLYIYNKVKDSSARLSKILVHAAGIVCMAALLPLFASCSEKDDAIVEYADWQQVNENYWTNLYRTTQQLIADGDRSWKLIPCYSYRDTENIPAEKYIVVHVLKEGTGSGSPLSTDSVQVNYRGHLLPSTSYSAGYQFDSTWAGEYNEKTASPTTLSVLGLVDGFATALQEMHIGDRWEVYIPYQMGYGTNASGSIPAYSTLIFDMSLVAYWRAGSGYNGKKARYKGQDGI